MVEEEKRNKFTKMFSKRDSSSDANSDVSSDSKSSSGLEKDVDGAKSSFANKFKNTKSNDIKSLSSSKRNSSENNISLKAKKSKGAESHATRITKSRKECLYLVKGKDTTAECPMCKQYNEDCTKHGNICRMEAWHYVHVDFDKKEIFNARVSSGSVNVSHFGKVLASGWGRNPPPEVLEKIMKEHFGEE